MSKKSKIDVDFAITKDRSHDNKFTGNISFTNHGEYFKGWTLEFNAPFQIKNIKNAKILSHEGDRYKIQHTRSNDDVYHNETTKLRFDASVKNHTITEPSNYVFNQQPLGITQKSIARDVAPQKTASTEQPKKLQNQSASPVDIDFKIAKDRSHANKFTGNISFTNHGEYFKGWTLEFNAPFQIKNIKNAKILSHEGDRYVIQHTRSNDDVYRNETTTFSFDASVKNHTITGPYNYVFNQQPLGISSNHSNNKDDSDDNNKVSLPSSPSPSKSSKSSSSKLSSQAITVDFEKHSNGTKYSQSAQNKDWNVDWSKPSWMNNYTQVTNKEAHDGNKSLRVTYRSNAKTGADAAWEIPAKKEYYLSYWIKFDNDFDFDGSKQSGGKLPGLGGAGGLCSGGDKCTGNNGFTARYMWRKNGRAQLYLYHMDKPEKFGEEFWFKDSDGDDVYFKKGKWHNLIQRVKINDGKKSNGEVDVWMDKEQVLSIDGLKFVTNNKGVDTVYFNSFHGGSGSGWWPDHEVHSYFDEFEVSTNASDVGL